MKIQKKLRWYGVVVIFTIFMIFASLTTVYASDCSYTSNNQKGKWESDYIYKQGSTYPTGWVKISITNKETKKTVENTYYFMADRNKNYKDTSVYRKKGGYIYYLNKNGVLVKTNRFQWQIKNGKDILVNVDTNKPAVTSAFYRYNKTWYYADSKGLNVTGFKTINDKKYYFNDNGELQVEKWINISDKYYRTNAKGVIQTGFKKINDKMYHFADNGIMHTGWRKINDKYYYFNSNGVMRTGWQKIDGHYYYFSNGGVMLTGWRTINGKKYYLTPSGKAAGQMVTGWQQINSKTYYFGTDGAMRTGYSRVGDYWYKFDSNGVKQILSKETQDGNDIYWPADSNGKLNRVTLSYSGVYNITSNHLTRSNGSLKYNSHWETWYSSREGSVGNSYATSIKGGRHLASDGTYRDVDGFIIVACNQKFHRYGEIIMTTVGPAKVYDCGCSYGLVDISTNW